MARIGYFDALSRKRLGRQQDLDTFNHVLLGSVQG